MTRLHVRANQILGSNLRGHMQAAAPTAWFLPSSLRNNNRWIPHAIFCANRVAESGVAQRIVSAEHTVISALTYLMILPSHSSCLEGVGSAALRNNNRWI